MESFKIANCPNSAYYLRNFLSVEEEEQLLRNVNNVPKPKWTQLTHRRLQNWGGIPHPKGMVVETIPQWLQLYMDKVSKLNMFGDKKPNHVLINEYKPNQGIMPHLDGPLYHPVIATLNLGSHTVLNFYKNEEKTVSFSLFLEPRSLLIQENEIYNNFRHGIEEREEDSIGESVVNLSKDDPLYGSEHLKRGTRISLTIRHVIKSTKIKIRL